MNATNDNAMAALLREWLGTEGDSQDEGFQEWIDSFTARATQALAIHDLTPSETEPRLLVPSELPGKEGLWLDEYGMYYKLSVRPEAASATGTPCSSYFPDEVTDNCIRCGQSQAAHASAVTSRPEARAIVEQHRRHVELSPGVGAEVQKYALAVCDDILADLNAPPMNSVPHKEK